MFERRTIRRPNISVKMDGTPRRAPVHHWRYDRSPELRVRRQLMDRPKVAWAQYFHGFPSETDQPVRIQITGHYPATTTPTDTDPAWGRDCGFSGITTWVRCEMSRPNSAPSTAEFLRYLPADYRSCINLSSVGLTYKGLT